MKLDLKRIFKGPLYTIGNLYIDGAYFCNTLEDPHRPDGIKIQGDTCISEGTYKIIINMSNRFKKLMPLLLNVPNFEGIRIHSGNTAANTSGCILVGQNKVKGKVINSKETFNKLFKILQSATDDIFITIT